MKYYTYIHMRESDKQVFYVGKGSGNRASSSLQRNKIWNHVAKKHGFKSEILMRFDKEEDSFEHEKLIILCFKDMGINLVNQTDGGEGSSGFKLTEDTKKKIGAAVKARDLSINKKISSKLKGRKLSDETKLKMSTAKLGIKKSEEHRKNISKGAKGRFFSEATRKKLSEAATKQHKEARNGKRETNQTQV